MGTLCESFNLDIERGMSLMLQEIISSIYSSPEDISGHRKFLEEYRSIQHLAINLNGLKSTYSVGANQKDIEKVKALSIVNDFSRVYAPVSNGGHLIFPTEESNSNCFPTAFTVSSPEFASSLLGFSPCFIVCPDEDFSYLLNELYPLIESGRILLSPEPAVMLQTEGLSEVVSINPDSDPNRWELLGHESKQTSIPTTDINDSFEDIFEVTYPYIAEINAVDFVKILEESNDTIKAFRKSIKVALSEYRTHSCKSVEIQNDIIEPEIEKLNRQYRKISNMRSIKTAFGTIGAVGLGIASAKYPESAIFSAIGSGMNLTYAGKSNIEFYEKRHELKDNPYYLLWNLKRLKNNM